MKYLKNLEVPKGKIDVVLDTDAYNEIDDQFAIVYMLRSKEKLNTVALYAAPFHNINSSGPKDGMERSYIEIKKILKLLGEDSFSGEVFRGSERYLENERTPVISEAAEDLAKRAMNYTEQNPLYVVAIGAITNIASALLINPDIAQRIVVVWLGGHSREWSDTREFNMWQDVAAARVVMGSAAPFVQLPCMGVVSEFRISEPELRYWLSGKSALADYLAMNTMHTAFSYVKPCSSWTRVIWDVTAVAWLLNDGNRFLRSRVTDTYLPSYEGIYEDQPIEKESVYVYGINRDALMTDLIEKILN